MINDCTPSQLEALKAMFRFILKDEVNRALLEEHLEELIELEQELYI